MARFSQAISKRAHKRGAATYSSSEMPGSIVSSFLKLKGADCEGRGQQGRDSAGRFLWASRLVLTISRALLVFLRRNRQSSLIWEAYIPTIEQTVIRI